ncbi:protein argonaute 4-like, partial [Trifolium medium]|nr:protein argonaute 4-like [Trifolium medium]
KNEAKQSTHGPAIGHLMPGNNIIRPAQAPAAQQSIPNAMNNQIAISARCDVRGLVGDLIKCGGMKSMLVEQPFDVFEENGQSKLPGAPKFHLCLLPERKNSDHLYG